MSKFSKSFMILIIISCILVFSSCTGAGAGTDTEPGETSDTGTDTEADETTESVPPVISNFSLPNGNLTADELIAVSITDDGTATAWMITTSETTPAADSADWLTECPADCTLETAGIFNLYAWAKNSAGLVSESKGPLSVQRVEGPGAGEIIITEFMANPSVTADTVGEWFEIYNTSSGTINLKGCVFSDDGANSFTISEDLQINPSSYITLAISSTPGFTPDYIYAGFNLSNSDDEILIASIDGTLIDSISYISSDEGKSSQLIRDNYSSIENDTALNWTLSTATISPTNSDLGTPGADNNNY